MCYTSRRTSAITLKQLTDEVNINWHYSSFGVDTHTHLRHFTSPNLPKVLQRRRTGDPAARWWVPKVHLASRWTRRHYGQKARRWRQCHALGEVLLGNHGSSIHVDVTLTRKHSRFMKFTNGSGLWFGLKNIAVSSVCRLSLRISQIVIWSNFCGTCWS